MTVIRGIRETGAVGPGSGVHSARRSAGAGFKLPAEPGPASPMGIGSSPALDALIAVQDAPGDTGPAESVTDRAARRHSQALLDALGLLQRGLLAGQAPAAILDRLAGLAEQPQPVDSAPLSQAMAAVRARVWVELARRGRMPGQ